MKNRNYWLERGKNLPQKEGFVCLGSGNAEEWLSNFFPSEKIGSFSGTVFETDLLGNSSILTYYIKKEDFEQILPPDKVIIPCPSEIRSIFVEMPNFELKNIYNKCHHLFPWINFDEFSMLVREGNVYIKNSFITNFLSAVPNPLEFRY